MMARLTLVGRWRSPASEMPAKVAGVPWWVKTEFLYREARCVSCEAVSESCATV